MRGWYGPPIAVAGVPGSVWACKDGDFRGRIAAGQFVNAWDFSTNRLKRILRAATRPRYGTLNAGFSGLDALKAAATQGNRLRVFPFNKAPGTLSHETVANSISLWRSGTQPAAAGVPSNAPGGDAPDKTTTGAYNFTNPDSGETQHLAGVYATASSAPNTLMIYDRIFQVNKLMNSTATEAVTGVPTRYQSQTATDDDYIGGNFLFVELGSSLTAGGVNHNWTVCLYTDEGGASSTLPSIVINNSNDQEATILDMPPNRWFAPLETGDVGIGALTQMQCSVAIATGSCYFAIGHPLAFVPCQLTNLVCQTDGINSAFSLVRIFDNAALALMQISKPAVTACTMVGRFETVTS